MQPLTSASSHVTRGPGPPAAAITGRRVGRSSSPQPAHSERWQASDMSMLNVKSQRLSVELSCAAVVYATPQSEYMLLAKRASVIRR